MVLGIDLRGLMLENNGQFPFLSSSQYLFRSFSVQWFSTDLDYIKVGRF